MIGVDWVRYDRVINDRVIYDQVRNDRELEMIGPKLLGKTYLPFKVDGFPNKQNFS